MNLIDDPQLAVLAKAMGIKPPLLMAHLAKAGFGQPGSARDAELITFERSVTLQREAINVEERTIEFALSSEEPYDRWWGREVLSHERTAVRLGRLNSGTHPLLVDHDTRDQVGVIVRAWIGDDRRLRCIARFGKSARAEEIFQDVRDGIRSLVSVGYRIHSMVLAKQSDAGDEYLVDDWEPHEGSIVAVPADPTVGIGRAGAQFLSSIRSLISNRSIKKESTVDDDTEVTNPPAGKKADPKIEVVDAKRAAADATAQERQRVRDITALGAKFKREQDASAAIEAGTPYDAFREKVFGEMERSGALKLADANPDIGLSKKEVQQFRLTNVIAACLWPDDQIVRKRAAFEIECARAAADKREGVSTERAGALTIPTDVLRAPLDVRTADADQAFKLFMQRAVAGARLGTQQRDLVVGTATAGGNLVATELLASSFIDILVNQMRVMSLGTTMLTDLVGNIAIPRATAGSTGYWVAENSGVTESQQAFDQVALTPKTAGAYVDYSRRLLLQSSIAVEAFVRMDIARTIALLIDLAAINGSGSSNQPRGVLNTSGIGSVVGGTNGLAPTWDHMVDLQTAVANANAPEGSRAYFTNTKVRGKLKRTQQFSSTNGRSVWEALDEPAVVSNQVPSNLTKGSSSGVCSAIAYGNWADLLIGMWGGLDIMLDPYTGATAGTKRVVALQDVDVAVRYPVSFAAMLDALTV